jgi:TRAP-type C4-dicarboxylate transport system permease small subunit
MGQTVNLWYLVDQKLSRVEQGLVTVLLTVMILLAFAQIVLRNFFATGIDWGDALVRYLVVWVGFIGAALATQEDKHITIDVLSRWFTGAGNDAVKVLSDFVSAVVCGLLTWAGINFILFEAQMGGVVFFKLPIWLPELIIPISFGLMTLRYALRLLNTIMTVITGTRRAELQK